MKLGDIMALTVCGRIDPAIAAAACRAGARGCLDLELAADESSALGAIERLERLAAGPFGVKFGPHSGAAADRVAKSPPSELAWVLIAGGQCDEVSRWAKHAGKVEVLWEATSVEEAELAWGLPVDGLVLKGEEAGGRIGTETAFVLLQHWSRHVAQRGGRPLPVWVQGAIGLNTAAACVVAGARGVVLGDQLLLARESPLDEAQRAWVSSLDGTQTRRVGAALGEVVRVGYRPGAGAAQRLAEEEERIRHEPGSAAERLAAWRGAVLEQVAQSGPGEPPVFLGQDAALAKTLADRFVTVAGIVQAIQLQVGRNVEAARRLEPLAPGSPLARSHGTTYPLFQGPMTRVSDTAAFAEAVAAAGGLPFLALALMRGPEAQRLLGETAQRLDGRPWGAGILGFVPPQIRREQVEALRGTKPPVALIAGGRPDQARELEKEGIATYLHVPSPELLRMFLRDGARRFVFEGGECGGHVGPRSSFLLWETMAAVLAEHVGRSGHGDDLHVIFAGGIHDALSGAMVAALAAPLAERGVKVGALMGTAYLFTREAVASGAIVERFQQEALSGSGTVLFETGPGHAVRCLKTPYFDAFEAERARLRAEGRPHQEIVTALEWMNIGRLRVASKGVDRARNGAGPAELVSLPEEEQYGRGMYMIGQVAALRDEVTTMAQLHAEVCEGGTRRLEEMGVEPAAEAAPPAPCDVAIVGMSCSFPKAPGLGAYWENILERRCAITEVPPGHWDWRPFYDPDPQAKDKIISKWGGFVDDVPFDPLSYGITPNSLRSIEPLQLLVLEAVRGALADAGYADRPFDRRRTCAVLGIGGGGCPMSVAYGLRSCLPMLDSAPGIPATSAELMRFIDPLLPQWTEDSFPGILTNVAVGRVANRFDFGGSNYAVDAACASSLAAVHCAVRELQLGTADVAVAMGADTVQTPYAYMAFSKTYALSPRGRSVPFDASADGIVLSEGVGVVILKRLADARRDGDRIYAVIKGMGASSDGRAKGLTAPNSQGQISALLRAYGQAGISPARAGLIEAHGTGTVAGDRAEAESLSHVMREAGAPVQSCALGSVKSMIGHTKCSAGVAGLIKAALALYHKVLPPTLVERPNPTAEFEKTALYLNTEARPWVHGGDAPRVAGASAFGFGGTNSHAVLEEYRGDYWHPPEAPRTHWPAELLAWRRPTKQELVESVRRCAETLAAGARPELSELAASVWRSNPADPRQPVLAVVATSLEDLKEKLAVALAAMETADRLDDPRGIQFAVRPDEAGGKVAFLFPGQGSQYPDMLAQVAIQFPQVREALDRAERTLAGALERPLGQCIYPPSSFTPQQEQQARAALAQTDVAQPALGAAGLGMARLLGSFGLEPDFMAGHSYGEYVALCAAGAMDDEELIRLSHRRGSLIRGATGEAAGGMAAVDAGAEAVAGLLNGLEGVCLANLNAPNQTVISGTDEALETVLKRCAEKGLRGRRIPVACAFHSPLVAPAAKRLAAELAACTFRTSERPVFSNTTAGPYPDDPAAMAALLARHLVSPVRFQEEIEAMYAAGARVFLEVGPQAVLCGLVGNILGERPHLAAASDRKGRHGLVQIEHLLGQLLARGVAVRLDPLFQSRGLRTFDLAGLAQETGQVHYSPSTWLVNGQRARPIAEPEPRRLGQVLSPIPATPPQASAPPAAPETKGKPASPHVTTRSEETISMTQPGAEQPLSTGPAPRPAADLTAGNGHLAAPAPWAAADGTDEAAQVMAGFQNLMAKFLDTQREIMLQYLAPGTHPAPDGYPAQTPWPAAGPDGNGHAHDIFAPSHTDGQGVLAAPPPLAEQAQPLTPPHGAGASPDGMPVPAASDVAAENGFGEPAAPAPTMEGISAQLLDLVSQRTGYPKDMLDLDLDLEADLGIDSIKRVEILGGLAESLGGSGGDLQANLELERLTTIRTLRGILDCLREALATDGHAAGASPAGRGAAADEDGKPSGNGQPSPGAPAVARGLVRLIEAPLPAGSFPSIPGGAVLLTDDGRGVADEIASRLADFGQPIAVLRMAGADGAQARDGAFSADLTDPAAVKDLVARVRSRVGPVAGLVHALPLAEASADDWAGRARRDVKSLYLLARELEQDICSADERAPFLLAATAMGGGLGYDGPLPVPFLPGHGGVLGFTKCLGMEWSDVLVRGVDLDATRPAAEMADRLLAELGDPEGPLEVGYLDGRRVTWEPYAAPLEDDADGPPPADRDATLLVTGGARGITAEIAVELGRRYRPTLVLVGRSPLPEPKEPADTARLTAPAEIKAALVARLRREGRPAGPAEVEAIYRPLVRDREIRRNLARIGQTGARAHYYGVDLRDERAVAKLVREIEERFGGIDGVIHGAGVIEDKLVRDKTPESFDRVFDTKVRSAHNLVHYLKPDRLRFCVFFASIASRYGNRGQADYAAANEVLSKLAADLDRRWPCRVFSVAWGPWSSVGMVSELERHLAARGVALIAPELGRVLLADELARGAKGQCEVLIAGGAENVVRPQRSRQPVAG